MQWRDIRAALSVVTEPAFEPVSRAEAKLQCRVDQADEDHLFDAYIAAARRQIVKDTGRVPVNTLLKLTVDAFPTERYVPFPRWPLKSIASIVSYDDADVSATFASSKYFADTVKARVYLDDGESWPTDLRNHNAGEIQFTAGDNGDPVTVSSLTSNGTAPSITATVTATAHGFSTGDRITIVGAAQDAYNGTFTIAKVDADSFTYRIVSGTPATPATGAITARKLNVPASLHLAMLLLVSHWYGDGRQPVNIGNITTDIPMTYSILIGGSDRVYAMA